ncbi:tetratricopeptide repeat protein, partial [Desulfobacterales bacterium HSG17]|nr:tetratricopeptide repeat protein [Desulfobacterales bacterium HSG17]
FQWFLLPSVILLLLELTLSSKKRLNSSINILSVLILVFALNIIGFSTPSIAQAKTVSSSVKEGIAAFEEKNYEQAKKHFIDAQLENPENRKLYYNIGTAAYMNKEYEQAKTNFKHALESDDKNLRHDARYNLANTHYRLGNLEDAIKEYKNILKEFPEDINAKENLEFVQKKKQEQKKQESKSDKNSDKDKDKDKDKEQDRQDKKDKDQPENEQDKEQKKNREKNRNNSEQKDKNESSQQNQKQDANRDRTEPQKGQQQDKLQNQDSQQEQDARNMENMLNRLEDKPGKAMMPVFKKQYVEKDW